MDTRTGRKEPTNLQETDTSPDEVLASWEATALHSMSRLAEEFAQRPEFGRLLDLALATVSRQLRVEDAFAAILSSHWLERNDSAFAGSGRFEDSREIKQTIHQSGIGAVEGKGDLIDLSTVSEGPLKKLHDSGVRFLAVMRAQNHPLGVFGLASRSDGIEFTKQDLALLRVLTKTVAPIISNAHVFGEMNAIRSWYASILNNVRQGVFVFDQQFRMKMANLAGLRILEDYLGPNDESKGLNGIPITEIFTEDKFPGWADRIEAMGIIADSSRPFQLVAKDKNGRQVFTVHIASCSDWRTDDLDVIVTVEDITSQKDAESRMMHLERLADKGTMSSAIAHELNNFLGLILGGIDVSLACTDRDDSAKRIERLEKLKDHAMTMRRFTAGLIDKHQLDTKLISGQLNDVISEVVAFAQVQKRFRNVHIQHQLSRNVPEVRLDINQLSQVLLNFLNNAADAIWQAERETGAITIRTQLKRRQVEISIADNGIGIEEELRNKLFRENFTTKDSGHGYGLTTCKAILDKHRAHVDVESIVGEGTTFRLRFPVDFDEAESDR